MGVAAVPSRLSVGMSVAFVTGNMCGWATFPGERGGRGSAHERCLGPSPHIPKGNGGRGSAHERCLGPSLHIPRSSVNSDYLFLNGGYAWAEVVSTRRVKRPMGRSSVNSDYLLLSGGHVWAEVA